MPSDTPQVIDAAEKLGKLIADHPVIEKYKAAQRSLSEDAEASRLLGEFDRLIDGLAQQEATGRPVSEAQRSQLEAIQTRLASNLKVKNLSIVQVEMTDLLRKVSQAWQRPVAEAQGAAKAAAAPQRPSGPSLVMPGM
jgi:cell fate (sporulation/competence/biofilm development) regulator YlbF (YheA/YmcA/DUF963 family)